MRARTGFVSNSSSSSFVCGVCGRSEIVYSDDGFENESIIATYAGYICKEEWEQYLKDQNLLDRFEKLKKKNTRKTEYEIDDSEVGFAVVKDKKLCPFYNLHFIPKDLIFAYLLKKNKIDLKEIEEEIRVKFQTVTKFKKHLGIDPNKISGSCTGE